MICTTKFCIDFSTIVLHARTIVTLFFRLQIVKKLCTSQKKLFRAKYWEKDHITFFPCGQYQHALGKKVIWSLSWNFIQNNFFAMQIIFSRSVLLQNCSVFAINLKKLFTDFYKFGLIWKRRLHARRFFNHLFEFLV